METNRELFERWREIQQDQLHHANIIEVGLARRDRARQEFVNSFTGWNNRRRMRIRVINEYVEFILKNGKNAAFWKIIGYSVAATGNLLSFTIMPIGGGLQILGGSINLIVEGIKINKETTYGQVIETLLANDDADTQQLFQLLGNFYHDNRNVVALFNEFKNNSSLTPLFKISKDALEQNLNLVNRFFREFPQIFHNGTLARRFEALLEVFPYILEHVTNCLNFIGHYFNYDTATGVWNIALGAVMISDCLPSSLLEQANALGMGLNLAGLAKAIDEFSDEPMAVRHLRSIVNLLEDQTQTIRRAAEEPNYEEQAQRMNMVPNILRQIAREYEHPERLLPIVEELVTNEE